jgi:hypothetical protein
MTQQERDKYKQFLLTELKKMDEQTEHNEKVAVE